MRINIKLFRVNVSKIVFITFHSESFRIVQQFETFISTPTEGVFWFKRGNTLCADCQQFNSIYISCCYWRHPRVQKIKFSNSPFQLFCCFNRFQSLFVFQTLLILSLGCPDHKSVRASASKVSFHRATVCQYHVSPNRFTHILQQRLTWIYHERMKAKAVNWNLANNRSLARGTLRPLHLANQ